MAGMGGKLTLASAPLLHADDPDRSGVAAEVGPVDAMADGQPIQRRAHWREDRDASLSDVRFAGQHQLDLARFVRPLIHESYGRAQANVAAGHRLRIMEFGTLDLLKQHRRNDRLPVLGPQGQTGDDVGLRRKQVNGGSPGGRVR